MLGKVPLIGPDDVAQCLLHGSHIPGLGPHQHWLRHSAGDIVHLELFIQRVKKRIGNRFQFLHGFQVFCQIIIPIGNQKFRKSHGVDLHEIYFSHRKRRRLCQRNAQQRTGTGDMILWGVLAEVFHGIDDLGAVLHLVKNNECLFRRNFLPAGQH